MLHDRAVAAVVLSVLVGLSFGGRAFAQTATPSPSASPSAAPVTTYDGHYTGTSTSRQGCAPGSFDLSVKAGAFSGNAEFKIVYRSQDYTLSYDASGSIDADGKAKVQFHTSDVAIAVNRRDFGMGGTSSPDGISLSEGGQTCGHSVTLVRSKT